MRIQEYVCTKHTVWKVVYEPFNGSVTQKLSQLNESPGHLLSSLPWQPSPGANYELSVRCKKWTYITYIHHLHICNIYIQIQMMYIHIYIYYMMIVHLYDNICIYMYIQIHDDVYNIYVYLYTSLKYNYLHISVTSSWHQKSTLSDHPRPRNHAKPRGARGAEQRWLRTWWSPGARFCSEQTSAGNPAMWGPQTL